MPPRTMPGHARLFSLLLFSLALPASLPAQTPAPSPAAMRGIFRILVQGREVGREEFEIERRATEIRARARLTLKSGDEKVEETATLTLSLDYEPREYEWKRLKPPGQFVRVRFDGSRAMLEYPLANGELDQREFVFEGTRLAILDGNFFHHYFFLLRQYDTSRGGPQPIRILIPQGVFPAFVTLEAQGSESVAVDGVARTLKKFRMSSEEGEVWLWVDENAELVRLAVPHAQVEVLRVQP